MSEPELVGVNISVTVDGQGKYWAAVNLSDGRSKRTGPFDTMEEAKVKMDEAIALLKVMAGPAGLFRVQ